VQVLTSIPAVYLTSFPDQFQRWVNFFAHFVDVNFIEVGVPFDCIGLASFHAKLWAYILLPLTVICVTILASALTVLANKPHGPSVSAAPALTRIMGQAAPMCIFIAFLSMPSVTALASRSFLVECFDEGLCYLRADYAVIVGPRSSETLDVDVSRMTPEWQVTGYGRFTYS
jgi:hypothetical protein